VPEPWSEQAFDEALALAREGEIAAAGIHLGEGQLAQVVAQLPLDATGQYRARRIDLDGALVAGPCSFRGVTCDRLATFQATTFEAEADFSYAIFTGTTSFEEARFGQLADFDGCTFEGIVVFERATFAGGAAFTGCRFHGSAVFSDMRAVEDVTFQSASFVREALFGGAIFEGGAQFVRAEFNGFAQFRLSGTAGLLNFGGARIHDHVDFAGVVASTVSFARARIHEMRMIGPILADGALSLDQTIFETPVRIEVSARKILCRETTFLGGADIIARWAAVDAEGADFVGASLIAPLAPPGGDPDDELLGYERPLDDGWEQLDEPPTGFEPRIVSLRGAKVARLTLSHVNLRTCRFASAHGLDDLRLESVTFSEPPTGWSRAGRKTRRRTIAEEHDWRETQADGAEWSRAPRDERASEQEAPLDPDEIASLYRALRRGRERERDEAGASDFYYGEMEMRRKGARGSDRLLLWLYWLIAGYGLRASRALAALVLTLAVLAVPLSLWGFRPDQSYGRALLFAAESSISLLHAPVENLTAGGEVVQITLRLAGPLFFGLAVLALRSRVKR
jgi:uncharacterized protein YjbI with pentapeptide repeats